MKTLTHEWVAKAEGDFTCVQREWRARKSPNLDAVKTSDPHSVQVIIKDLSLRQEEAA
jgi:hypothetical protein